MIKTDSLTAVGPSFMCNLLLLQTLLCFFVSFFHKYTGRQGAKLYSVAVNNDDVVVVICCYFFFFFGFLLDFKN